MPGKVKVRILGGRNLPVMDRSSDTTDAYVEVKLANTTFKTDVYRKSLNPQWNSEWFIFEVDDLELQDEPLQIRLMDHDTYSANDAIGKVYINLNPLLLTSPQQSNMSRNAMEGGHTTSSGTALVSGWLPVYDTMHGIRGEVNVVVKVDLFSDFNKFRQSSCGVQFFFTPEIPAGFRCQNILGFIEELVVNDDPEYQWIDKIRTPRASNEARQTLFSKLSGELQRRIGLKVLELGGNAVIGYRLCFDLEGESGIVVRGIGSAVTLIKTYYESAFGVGNTHSPSPLRESAVGSGPFAARDKVEKFLVDVQKCSQLTHVSFDGLLERPLYSLTSRDSSSANYFFSSQVPLERRKISSTPQMLNLVSPKMRGRRIPGQIALCSSNSKKSFSSGRKQFEAITRHPPLHSTQPCKPMSSLFVSSKRKKGSNTFPSCLSNYGSSYGRKAGFRHRILWSFDAKNHSKNFNDIKPKKNKMSTSSFDDPLNSDNTGQGILKSTLDSKRKISNGAETYKKEKISFQNQTFAENEAPCHDLLRDISVLKMSSLFKGLSLRLCTSEPTLSVSSFGSMMENCLLDPNMWSQNFSSDDALSSPVTSVPSSPNSPSPKKHLKFYLGDEEIDNSTTNLHDSSEYNDTLMGQDKFRSNLDTQHQIKNKVAQPIELPGEPSVGLLSEPLLINKNEEETVNLLNFDSVPLHVTPGVLPSIRLVPSSPSPAISSKKVLKLGHHERFERKSTAQYASKGAHDLSRSKLSQPLLSHSRSEDCINRHITANSAYSASSYAVEVDVPHFKGMHRTPLPVVSLSKCNNFVPLAKCDSFNLSTFGPMHASCSLVELSSKPSPTVISPTVLHASPKRRSRCRHTSGCYPISRSPQLTDGIESSKGEGGSGNQVSGPAQSPTHSGKITSPAHSQGMLINRRSSDSDLSITPKGGSLTGSGGSGSKGTTLGGPVGGHRPVMTQESFDMLEYPFLSMKSFPPGFLLHLGGSVSAKSVKLLDRGHAPEEEETRDSWWTQLRTEIRSHARALSCNVVLGYEEFTTICDEVCILSVSGTAAVISLQYHDIDNLMGMPFKMAKDSNSAYGERRDSEFPQQNLAAMARSVVVPKESQNPVTRSHPTVLDELSEGASVSGGKHRMTTGHPPCSICHIPYLDTSLPFKVKIVKCGVCRKGKVPDVLFTTLELPTTLPVTGRGCLIQSRVCRPKRDLKGELNAREVSDSLSFLEYEIHKQLYYKLQIKGMNALFGLRVRITLGEKYLVGVASATAVYLTALPPPLVPKITVTGGSLEEKRKRAETQKCLQEAISRNREYYGIRHMFENICSDSCDNRGSETDDSDEEELPEIDLSSGNKDSCILELDDLEDAELITLLMDCSEPDNVTAVTTQLPPGIVSDQIINNVQMFTRVWRSKLPFNPSHSVFSSYFDKLLLSIYFKVRKLLPCVLAGLQFSVELPEEDELQISVYGMVLRIRDSTSAAPVCSALKMSSTYNTQPSTIIGDLKKSRDEGELIFRMEDESTDDKQLQRLPSSSLSQKSQNISNPLLKNTSSTHSFHSVSSSFPSVPSAASFSSGSSSSGRSSSLKYKKERLSIPEAPQATNDQFGIEITPLSFIAGGARVERYLGNLNFFFIRESTSIKESGGLSGFMGCFVNEVLALVRAHVASLGGNALLSYFMSECVLLYTPHKNQGQCLINVGGDIVCVVHSKSSQTAETISDNLQQSNLT